MVVPKDPKQLAKFLAYMLGRRPDEFGLVPDENGFIKVGELLQALNEEDGWRHVRRRDIDEIFWKLRNPPIEMKADALRAGDTGLLPRPLPAKDLPKLLYGCIRRRAHAAVLEKGIFPMGGSQVVLASNRELAERIGKRRDPRPVLLTVYVRKMLDQGLVFYQLGQMLFLTETVPVACFGSPPLAEQAPKPPREVSAGPAQPAGAFLLDLSDARQAGPPSRGKYKKKDAAWKKDRKLLRKRKEKSWPE